MKPRIWIALSIALFTADRILKLYVQSRQSGIFAFSPGLEFGYFLNPALFFFPVWKWIPWLALSVLGVLIAVAVYRVRSKLLPNPYPLAPIILGGLSNVFDRFAFRGVIDYVHIRGLATINIADILILLGILLLIFRPKLYDQRS